MGFLPHVHLPGSHIVSHKLDIIDKIAEVQQIGKLLRGKYVEQDCSQNLYH